MRLLFSLCAAGAVSVALAQPSPTVLTLPRALALAEEANPTLRSAKATLATAEGASQEAASLFRDNPQLSLEGTQRRPEVETMGGSYRESAIGIAQTIEIAGQQGFRREAAQHGLSATRAEVANARVQLRAEVESAFARVLLLQRRVAAESENFKLAGEASRVVGKRVGAGEDSRLDGNLASVEAERARSQLSAIEEQLIDARARLAQLLQLPADTIPEVGGELPESSPALRLEDLLRRAAERPELVALLQREAAAESRLKLEKAAAYPDVTLGLSATREGPLDARERATIFSISVPLPLFKRNQAGIGRALTERDQATIERAAGQRNGEAQVRELWLRLQALQVRLERLRTSALPRLDENLTLSRKAYDAGEIGILQLLLVNRQVLDARRDYLEALGDFTQIRISLERASAIHADPSRANTAFNARNP